MTNAAGEGTLPTYLQTAWGAGTQLTTVTNTSNVAIVSTPGFYKVDFTFLDNAAVSTTVNINIFDGTTSKDVFSYNHGAIGATNEFTQVIQQEFYVFLRSGDRLRGTATSTANQPMRVVTRQVADLNGNLINPVGFSFT